MLCARLRSGRRNLESGEADWTGKQAGTSATTGYSGQAMVVISQNLGTYQYALYCGGVESGIANVNVQATLAISTASLPDATVGAPYSLTLAATGEPFRTHGRCGRHSASRG